ncbi:ESX secretion-associated protein EspG [Saccharomonospora piscinae]|uniref:ESX secretion-associated protein EspG n=1 Tax=Saccharomonospora piscinae TaxID=687388 RepID=UPI0004633193|nr:ESX secretion-associated protein EspG [Saccharomonospora piscinae]
MAAELTLHTVLDALSRIGCHTPHPVFAGGARYVPPSAAARVAAGTLDELAAAGLTRGERLTPEFEDVLHVLARPHTEYIAHTRSGRAEHSALVAARGRSVVVAVRCDTRVRLDTATAHLLPDLLVDTLPGWDEPEEFEPFTVPAQRLRDGDAQEAHVLHDLLSRPEHGIGYLRVARQPDGGERVRAAGVVCYLDLDVGRVGLHRAGEHIAVFPGSPSRLASRVAALRATLD